MVWGVKLMNIKVSFFNTGFTAVQSTVRADDCEATVPSARSTEDLLRRTVL
jgi:hypothetical protein